MTAKRKPGAVGVDIVKLLNLIAQAESLACDLDEQIVRLFGRVVPICDFQTVLRMSRALEDAHARAQDIFGEALVGVADIERERAAADPHGEAEALRRTVLSLRRQVANLRKRRKA